MATTTATFDRVYIWERPVRLYHWATALSLVVLAATGLIIGRPPAFIDRDGHLGRRSGSGRCDSCTSRPATSLSSLWQSAIYWMFMGNQLPRWNNFYPVTPKWAKRQLLGVAAGAEGRHPADRRGA